MSVVYEDPDGKIVLRCKGADSTIAKILSPASKASAVYKKNKAMVETFAEEGLRTLFLAERVLTEEEFDEWARDSKEARKKIADREAAVDAVDAQIEKDMELIGTTAIEDKLQDNVKDTIEFMKQADIKVWVLTGDKVGTAKMIGLSTGLIENERDMILHEIRYDEEE